MDITKIAAVETAFIHFKDAKGAPLFDDGKKVGVTLYGPSSPAYAIVEEQQIARIVRRRDENDGKAAVAPRAIRIAETASDLAQLTASFDNLTYPPAGDKQGRELFEAFYSDPSLGFLTKQAADAIEKWGNFSPA